MGMSKYTMQNKRGVRIQNEKKHKNENKSETDFYFIQSLMMSGVPSRIKTRRSYWHETDGMSIQ